MCVHNDHSYSRSNHQLDPAVATCWPDVIAWDVLFSAYSKFLSPCPRCFQLVHVFSLPKYLPEYFLVYKFCINRDQCQRQYDPNRPYSPYVTLYEESLYLGIAVTNPRKLVFHTNIFRHTYLPNT